MAGKHCIVAGAVVLGNPTVTKTILRRRAVVYIYFRVTQGFRNISNVVKYTRLGKTQVVPLVNSTEHIPLHTPKIYTRGCTICKKILRYCLAGEHYPKRRILNDVFYITL